MAFSNGSSPVFQRGSAIQIATQLLAASQAANTPVPPPIGVAYTSMLNTADKVSTAFDKLLNDPASSVEQLADLCDNFTADLEVMNIDASGWTTKKKLTFVSQAVRQRRYARYDHAGFEAVLQSIIDHGLQHDVNIPGQPPVPLVHW
jgi:hypothetical protein